MAITRENALGYKGIVLFIYFSKKFAKFKIKKI